MRIRNPNPLFGAALLLICLGANKFGFAASAVSSAPAVVPIVGELQVDNETKSTELEISWPQPLTDVRMLAAHAFLETFGGDVLVAPTY